MAQWFGGMLPHQIPIVLPELDAGGEPPSVSCWLVETGESVEFGDRVVEVLIQGITFDVSAPVAGTLTRIDKPLDAKVAAGDILGWLAPQDSEMEA